MSSSDPQLVILFMFFGLCLGIFAMQILSRYGEMIPYTVMIFILGIFFAFISKSPYTNNIFEESVRQWADIDADVLLFGM